jgi:hypothetical protein
MDRGPPNKTGTASLGNGLPPTAPIVRMDHLPSPVAVAAPVCLCFCACSSHKDPQPPSINNLSFCLVRAAPVARFSLLVYHGPRTGWKHFKGLPCPGFAGMAKPSDSQKINESNPIQTRFFRIRALLKLHTSTLFRSFHLQPLPTIQAFIREL